MEHQPFIEEKITVAAGKTLLFFKMMYVPGGVFQMGSQNNDDEAYKEEKPQHEVRLSAFYMAECPVTLELWTGIMGENPAYFKGERRPVEGVSWFGAAVFCNALNKMTDRPMPYTTPKGAPFGWEGNGWTLPEKGEVRIAAISTTGKSSFRLPTEAQWEYAAKGGRSTHYAGSDLLDQCGWYESNSDSETKEVGLLLPNGYGLYDMSGNVWEWCQDWFGGYDPEPQENPLGPPQGDGRVVRGGGWNNTPRDCRAAYRGLKWPDDRSLNLGFRLALQ